ncbi:AAA family ATPase [Dyella dinghuensis]|nr:AAA family ATPase [Dyella dinghuensis]
MIQFIRLNDQEISLVPQEVIADPTLNLFAADSMTLIVGPNGAGKTHLMTRIGEAIKDRDPKVIASDGPLSKVSAIYLTLSHFGKHALNGHGLSLQTLNRRRENPKVTLKQMRHVDEYFGGRAPVVLRLTVQPKIGFDRLVGAMRRSPEIIEANASLKSVMRRVETARKELESAQSSTPVLSINRNFSELMNKLIKMEEVLTERILDRLRSRLDAGYTQNFFLPNNNNLLRAIHSLDGELVSNGYALTLLQCLYGTKQSHETSDKIFMQLSYALGRLAELGVAVDDIELHSDRYQLTGSINQQLAEETIDGLASLELGGVSSGLAALALQYSLLERAVQRLNRAGRPSNRSLLIMIDEGDVFLHPAWQQRYVDFVDHFVATIKPYFASVQVILTTHSPILVSDFPRDCIYRLGRERLDEVLDEDEVSTPHEPLVSFGAPLEAVVRHTSDAGALGTFAQRQLRKWAELAASGQPISQYHLGLIDDPVIRRMIKVSRGRGSVSQ